ncbi:MAG: polymorphic toxin type 17 domain-containing protein [Candidatus Thiodiazotropha taylori]|nr:polymorphic toxin type 17 domain-containing protein [Candidatus Thiodiazotropha taylori]MCG8097116.1 polymorphic toxin type 17 domain-containing protein [Candidatus Thiodiazotropha endolucinida]MCG8112258.1 polymorphic toxin type 17 domain-containing protein [Candidatus Thiodiazotropha taylori]MCW4284616.1 polymorphic toxin type 17 domain-containing protein [Candidatus Thiodiazotropha taylori]MCW4303755.1 polymorphic toxin type 17 domain-containing protein [Candidatus Thiodiazotropha taylori
MEELPNGVIEHSADIENELRVFDSIPTFAWIFKLNWLPSKTNQWATLVQEEQCAGGTTLSKSMDLSSIVVFYEKMRSDSVSSIFVGEHNQAIVHLISPNSISSLCDGEDIKDMSLDSATTPTPGTPLKYVGWDDKASSVYTYQFRVSPCPWLTESSPITYRGIFCSLIAGNLNDLGVGNYIGGQVYDDPTSPTNELRGIFDGIVCDTLDECHAVFISPPNIKSFVDSAIAIDTDHLDYVRTLTYTWSALSSDTRTKRALSQAAKVLIATLFNRTWIRKFELPLSKSQRTGSLLINLRREIADAELPTKGVKFVPKKNARTLRESRIGGKYVDFWGNTWNKGSSRTLGDPFEWDVTLSRRGKNYLVNAGAISSRNNHINVTPSGVISH